MPDTTPRTIAEMNAAQAVYQVGQWVRVKYSLMFNPYQIVELRGPFGGGGMMVYGLRFGDKLRYYTEVREDQVEAVVEPPPKKKRKPQTDAPAN